MSLIIDLHVHSKYSRAASRDMDLERLALWAKRKGIHVLGTGDFTHPAWFEELQEKLVPAEQGLSRLQPEIEARLHKQHPEISQDIEVRFLLTAEVSCIYKKNKKVHKLHSLISVPDLASVSKLREELSKYGDLSNDGNPILRLDAKELLDAALKTSPKACIIPSHIWEPWFSLFGNRSGFNSVEECFEELTPYIFALETGSSSDPTMNWRVSALDRYALLSHSDAHSPSQIGRKANLLNVVLTYDAIFDAFRSRDTSYFLGTLEGFPEESKYYLDGHRNCKVCFSPSETRSYNENCPVCGHPLTLGVMYRVEQLADRPYGIRPPGTPGFIRLLPLEEILSQLHETRIVSKKVRKSYHSLLRQFGTEFEILIELPIEELSHSSIPLFGEAVRRMRAREFKILPGYDGQSGRMQLFTPKELINQQNLFPVKQNNKKKNERQQLGLFKKNKSTPEREGQQLQLFPEVFEPSDEKQSDLASMRIQPIPKKQTTKTKEKDNASPDITKESLNPLPLSDPQEQFSVEETKTQAPAFPEQKVPQSNDLSVASQSIEERKRARFSQPSKHSVMEFYEAYQQQNFEPENPEAQRLLSRLNTEQKAIVSHWGSPIRLLAGSGTGKTRVLAHRIAYLIKSKRLHPSHILAFTFSNQAARELKQKLKSLIGSRIHVAVGTFRRFCLELLTDEKTIHKLINPSEKRLLLDQLSREQGEAQSRSSLRFMLDQISKAKQQLLSPDNFTKSDPKFAVIFRRYQGLLQEKGWLDLDDLLLHSVQELERNNELRQQLQLRFHSIHIDEYQDINPAQYQLLRLLTHSKTDLFVTGDPDQAIHGSQGASSQYIHSFEDDFAVLDRPVKKEVLWRNYRSPAVVLEASSKLLESFSEHQRIPLAPMLQGSPKIEYTILPNDHAEAEYIVQQIETLLDGAEFFDSHTKQDVYSERFGGLSLQDIVVFYRSSAQLSILEQAFSRSRIRHRSSQPNGLAEENELQWFFSFLRFLNNPKGDQLALHSLLKAWPQIGEKSCQALLKEREKNNWNSTELLKNSAHLDFLSSQQKQNLELLYELLKSMSEFIQDLPLLREKLLEALQQAPFNMLSGSLLNFSDAQLILVKQRMQGHQSIQNFLKEHLLEKNPDPYFQASEHVSIMSLQAAKGKEFPIVFIAGCEEGILPHFSSFKDPSKLEEEARLFSLGATRTQKQLYLSSARKRFITGIPIKQTTSRFVTSLSAYTEDQILNYGSPSKPKKQLQKQRQIPEQQKLFSK